MSEPVGYIAATDDVAGISPIQAHGDADAGGRDDVAGDAAQAVANAQARYREHEGDTYGQGSRIGDLMDLADVPEAGGKHTGGDDTGYPA